MKWMFKEGVLPSIERGSIEGESNLQETATVQESIARESSNLQEPANHPEECAQIDVQQPAQ